MKLDSVDFDDLKGWSPAALARAWPTFLKSCEAIAFGHQPLRAGLNPDPAFVAICRAALDLEPQASIVDRFFRSNFVPVRPGPGFVTGYYEPEVRGSRERTSVYRAPLFCRPSDLVDVRGTRIEGWDPAIEGARIGCAGRLEPYPERREIEAGELGEKAQPLVWLEDHVEVFLIQVQGSARVVFPDGERIRLVYDGRNGRPYTSIGRELIERGEIRQEDMSLATLKSWLRANGLEIGQRGREVMQLNKSYVFFRQADAATPAPVGGQGVPLTPLRSIAIDRSLWGYGVPVWINVDLSTTGFEPGRLAGLMIGQDTGSAIVGPARADIFIGSGSAAGEIAGKIRHPADFIAFVPK
ncbi:MAG: MltA domain-containing protein [Hyphomicrobiales bacterium]|nr:MltA domain-containing protein [Hyphomicrobiales bacterium]